MGWNCDNSLGFCGRPVGGGIILIGGEIKKTVLSLMIKEKLAIGGVLQRRKSIPQLDSI